MAMPRGVSQVLRTVRKAAPVLCRALSVRGMCQSPAAWRKLLWGDLSDPRRPKVSCRMCLDMI